MDLDLRQLLPLLIIGGGFAFTGTILYGAWLLGRYRGREERAPAELGSVEVRLQRLEQLVAHSAGSIERLEAAQRLTARLLTDGPAATPPAPRPLHRVITPH